MNLLQQQQPQTTVETSSVAITAKSSLQDIITANDIRSALTSKDFDESDKKEILKYIRYLEGYVLPKECAQLIIEYLLLPKDIYYSKKLFIQQIAKVSLSKLNNILFIHFNNKIMNLTNSGIPLQIRRNSICKLLLNKIDSQSDYNIYSKFNALYFNKYITYKGWITQYEINQDVFVYINNPTMVTKIRMVNKGKITNITTKSITVALYIYILDRTGPTGLPMLTWTNILGESVIIKRSSQIFTGDDKWFSKVCEVGLSFICI
jgi:hypothetical protein